MAIRDERASNFVVYPQGLFLDGIPVQFLDATKQWVEKMSK